MMPDVVMPEAKQAAKQAAAPLGLYVHWPFCRAKCPYCDFNSHLRDQVDHTRWAAALVRELETLAEQADRRGHHLSSIFIGGGTPSLMNPVCPIFYLATMSPWAMTMQSLRCRV